MRIADLLYESMVWTSLADAADKPGCLRQLADNLAHHPGVPMTAEDIFAALQYREGLGSTGVGGGVAIPHAKLDGLEGLVAGFCRLAEGVPFDAIDGQPVRLFFVLLVPKDSAGAHLKALARVSRLFRSEEVRHRLLDCTDPKTLYEALLSIDDQDGDP